MWKDFFYFSRKERRGVILLFALIVIVCVSFWVIPPRTAPDTFEEGHFQAEYDSFANSLRLAQRPSQKYARYDKRKQSTPIHYISFDPNEADSVCFAQLGLPGWMIKNIISYRTKGGRFRKKEDFAKIYGLTTEQYTILEPYISIASTESPSSDSLSVFAHSHPKDSFPKTIKYELGTLVDLNGADTTQLKMIPGIGSSIAKMIVGYRKQLGGFYDVGQLQEIRLRTDKLAEWFVVDCDSIEKLPINKMGIDALRKHPYINFYQAKVMVEHRKKRGNIQNLSELCLYEEFASTDIERLGYYVRFD